MVAVGPLTLSIGPFRWLRVEGPHFMMRYQSSDALLRHSRTNSDGPPPVPSCQQVGPNASRNTQSLIKLARQNYHGHRDGHPDRQFRHLGYRRHLQGLWTVVVGQGWAHGDFDRAIPPDLHRPAAADRPPIPSSAVE